MTISWYQPSPRDLMLKGDFEGWSWVHLRTAEQLAMEMIRFPDFDLQKVARMGGADRPEGEVGGFVSLRDPEGRPTVIGTFASGGIQWPSAAGGGLEASEIRRRFRKAIEALEKDAASFLSGKLVNKELQARKRPLQDPSRWPETMSPIEIEAYVDATCGCNGQHACDCVSVFNKARGKAWEEYNTGIGFQP